MQTQNYNKYNQMLKEEMDQRKTFELKKRTRDVEEVRRTSNRRMSLIQQAIRDKKQEDYQRGRRLTKVTIQTNLDGLGNNKVVKRHGDEPAQVAAREHQQDERETDNKTQMLLVREKVVIPAETSRGCADIREADRGVLQENRGHERELGGAEGTREAGGRGAEVRAAKLPAAEVIMIFLVRIWENGIRVKVVGWNGEEIGFVNI